MAYKEKYLASYIAEPSRGMLLCNDVENCRDHGEVDLPLSKFTEVYA
jgi:hypothetical protein